MMSANTQSVPALKKKKKRKVNPDDGVTHINIWLYGNTHLGRQIAHFYHRRFVHPVLGPFNSMEGLWHYVKTEEKDDALRKLYGIKAKDYGNKLTKKWVPNFKRIIIAANYFKIEQFEDLKELMLNSTLPFRMYYYHDHDGVLIEPEEYKWLVEGFEEVRQMFKEGRCPEELDYSHALGHKA